MRRTILSAMLTATLLVVPVSVASADHTGCEPHSRTQTAHERVPHRNQGTHQAHSSIPYCPPEDAPRHRNGDNDHQ